MKKQCNLIAPEVLKSTDSVKNKSQNEEVAHVVFLTHVVQQSFSDESMVDDCTGNTPDLLASPSISDCA